MITVRPRKDEDEVLLRRYLLGQASAFEQSAIEQRLLTDHDYFHRLLRAEEELTDEYVRGDLQGAGEEEFERYFLNSPERRENVEFAQALNRYLAIHAQPAPVPPVVIPRWRAVREFALLCAVIVLAATVGLLFRTTSQLRERIERNQVQRSQAEQREKALAGQLEQERKQLEKLGQDLANSVTPIHHGGSELASLVLVPGLSRTADRMAAVDLRPNIRRLRLNLKIEDGSNRSYRADLQTVEGEVVWSRNGLKARQAGHGKVVEIELPAALLTRSDYLVMLRGESTTGVSDKIGTYYFRALQK